MRIGRSLGAVTAVVMIASASWLAGHHSLANFNTSAPVWVKGTVVRFEQINPHSRIYLEQEENGEVRQWVVDGPSPAQLTRIGLDANVLKAGDVIEVCGFEGLESQRLFRSAAAESAFPDRPGRFMNGNLLVMPDGETQFWSDYGQLHQRLGPHEPDPRNR
jgi:hypothetical protein